MVEYKGKGLLQHAPGMCVVALASVCIAEGQVLDMATGRWNKIGCFLAALACLYGIGFVLFGFTAHAQDLTGAASSPRRPTVRVIMSDAESGSSRTDAFIKDYLQAVKEYANWDYV